MQMISLKIKIASSPKDLDMNIGADETVQSLGLKILRQLQFDESAKAIRLIFSGKLLSPPTALIIRDCKIPDSSFVHAVVSAKRPIPFVNESIESDTGNFQNQRPSYRGLDTLVSLGLTIDEIAALRSSFRESIDEHAALVPANAGEDIYAHRARVEQSWMINQDDRSEFMMNLPSRVDMRRALSHPGVGGEPTLLSASRSAAFGVDAANADSRSSNRDFLFGFLMGFMFGFISIFCVWDSNVSHRQRLGIMTGIICQLVLGMAQGGNDTKSASSPMNTLGSTGASTAVSPASATGALVSAGRGGGLINTNEILNGTGTAGVFVPALSQSMTDVPQHTFLRAQAANYP